MDCIIIGLRFFGYHKYLNVNDSFEPHTTPNPALTIALLKVYDHINTSKNINS